MKVILYNKIKFIIQNILNDKKYFLDNVKLKGARLMKEVYEITTIEQAKVFSHELRMRIMRCFLQEKPKTATHIADELGMAPSKIHYHVKELVKVGLLELVDTRENSGIIEKYYLPVAKLFRVNLNKEEIDEDFVDPKISLLRNTSLEIKDSTKNFPEEKQKVMSFYIDLTIEEKEQFLAELDEVFERWAEKAKGQDSKESLLYGLVFGIYPKKGGE
ncbi:ArsR family transcriptional regulator [Mesobacillus boroniphilus]|uniref:ArsR family transcriptional regulator n=2 Tax=Mesobacillus boroniphilus TaxID=308892 RepID=A0A944GZY1_9BACI|nr:ArsR family transcriptional regulator [Mesobacillus boroniphilus]